MILTKTLKCFAYPHSAYEHLIQNDCKNVKFDELIFQGRGISYCFRRLFKKISIKPGKSLHCTSRDWFNLLPFRAFCVEGPQNLMFVRPCVCPSVCPSVCLSGVCHAFLIGSIPDLSQFDVITSIWRNLRQTIYTEGSKGPPRPAGVI